MLFQSNLLFFAVNYLSYVSAKCPKWDKSVWKLIVWNKTSEILCNNVRFYVSCENQMNIFLSSKCLSLLQQSNENWIFAKQAEIYWHSKRLCKGIAFMSLAEVKIPSKMLLALCKFSVLTCHTIFWGEIIPWDGKRIHAMKTKKNCNFIIVIYKVSFAAITRVIM